MSEHALAVRDALVAMQAFFNQHGHHVTSAEFPIARALLDETVAELELHLGNRTEQRATAAGATARSRDLTGALYEILLPLHTAYELLVETRAPIPPVGRISRKAKRLVLLAQAEAYIAVFEQHPELFASWAVPADFAERARAAVAALRESSVVSQSARAAETGSTLDITRILKRAPKLVRHLSAIARPSLRRDGAVAEAWESTQRRLPSTSGVKTLKAGGPIALLVTKTGEPAFGLSFESPTITNAEAAGAAAPAEAPNDAAAKAKPPRRRKRTPGRPRKRAK